MTITLLLAITATLWCAVGALFGYLAGHTTARRHYEQREDQRWGEIRHFDDLYEQPAYGDD